MAILNGIQPNNLTTMPTGNAMKSFDSGAFQKTNQQTFAQEVAQNKPDIGQLKLREASDQLTGLSNNSIDSAALDTLMMHLNTQLKQLQNYMKFTRDESTDKMVIFIKDSETDEILRQIPTQEFLAISKSISQYIEMRQQNSEKFMPPVGMFTNETV